MSMVRATIITVSTNLLKLFTVTQGGDWGFLVSQVSPGGQWHS
jgi:hypothetical protein